MLGRASKGGKRLNVLRLLSPYLKTFVMIIFVELPSLWNYSLCEMIIFVKLSTSLWNDNFCWSSLFRIIVIYATNIMIIIELCWPGGNREGKLCELGQPSAWAGGLSGEKSRLRLDLIFSFSKQVINVYAPDLMSRRPVMVFIHGGGFFAGTTINFTSNRCSLMFLFCHLSWKLWWSLNFKKRFVKSFHQFQILLQGLVQAEFMDLTIWLLRRLCWSQSITGAARSKKVAMRMILIDDC